MDEILKWEEIKRYAREAILKAEKEKKMQENILKMADEMMNKIYIEDDAA